MKAKLNGKQKCEMLRNIRREIAARNNIEYLTADCTYKGDCLGTCPKCDAEVRFLEYELNRKIQEGQKVVITGINDNLVELINQVEKAVNDLEGLPFLGVFLFVTLILPGKRSFFYSLIG